MRSRLLLVTLAVAALVVAGPMAHAGPDDEVTLELTYPAGRSPNVFTQGWVFGARCTVTSAAGEQTDRSADVAWSGTGTFAPARGPLSHPAFHAQGENTITLTIEIDERTVTRSWTVTAIDPVLPAQGQPFAKLGDFVKCAACMHGCVACPHVVIGQITSGSPNVTIGGLPAARQGDTGTHSTCCGANMFEITGGDAGVLIDGKPAARLKHSTRHCGGVGEIMGPRQAEFVAFAPLRPEVRKERKIVRGNDETDEKWKARRARWVRSLTVADFSFDGEPDTKRIFVVHVRGDALAKAPWLLVNRRYALRVRGGSSLAGSILLTCMGVNQSLKALREAVPGIQQEALDKRAVLERADGTGTWKADGDQEFVLGPLIEGWSDASRKEAVDLVKSAMLMFDCFVAHAAYGDPNAPQVERLRAFRDGVLRRSATGRRLIRRYYDHGPALARGLRDRPPLRPFVRFGLDLVAGWLSRLDLDDPETALRLAPLLHLVDALTAPLWTDDVHPLDVLLGASR